MYGSFRDAHHDHFDDFKMEKKQKLKKKIMRLILFKGKRWENFFSDFCIFALVMTFDTGLELGESYLSGIELRIGHFR